MIRRAYSGLVNRRLRSVPSSVLFDRNDIQKIKQHKNIADSQRTQRLIPNL